MPSTVNDNVLKDPFGSDTEFATLNNYYGKNKLKQ